MSDIDTAVVDSLKVLDPNRPIREADIVLNTTMSASDPKRFIGVSDATPMYNLRHDDCS